MRLLFISTLYPPVAIGGYEVECSAVVDRLAERHEVQVMTSEYLRSEAGAQPNVHRELALLSPDGRGALRAPAAALRAVSSARAMLSLRPDLVYVWNASRLPQAALRVFADSGVPLAFRVCEHWFGRMFVGDQFLRELTPSRRSPPRAGWALGCRTLNRLPSLRLDPLRPFSAAISWNSEAIRRMAGVPQMVRPALERVCHSVPRHGDLYARLTREPSPSPEIAFVGRVTAVKGLDVAIKALGRLRSEHGIAARLLVIGPEDASHGAEMRRLAGQLGLASSVEWLGQRSPERVGEVLARAHVLIVPSRWDEPFPLVTIEGALARVPLVAADVGGIAEGMRHEEHALLFARGDIAAAADALARTLIETEATAARVRRARERAERFRLGPYLEAQERFMEEAYSTMSSFA